MCVCFFPILKACSLEEMVDLCLEVLQFFQYSIGSMGRLYIYLHEWLIFMVNVAKYTSPMDPMRYSIGVYYVEANLYYTLKLLITSS